MKKTEIFDKEGVLQRVDENTKLRQQLEQAQSQIKNLSGDLQTAQRETMHAKQKAEIEKVKGNLKKVELDAKADARGQVDKLSSSVKLESEKLRLANSSRIRSQAQKDSRNRKQNKEK